MGISLNPQHLKRYKDIAGLLLKYGRSDIVKEVGLDQAFVDDKQPTRKAPGDTKEVDPKGAELADDLERLGPIYVKMGQVLSSRADLLPEPYLQGLQRLQDKIDPFPYEEVERIVQEELGVRISKAFKEFTKEPLAAASLGQVHRAVMRDGREVVVKVQRPGIRATIAEDLEAFGEIAEFLDAHTEWGHRYHFASVLDEFRKNLARELDYKQEARNMREIANNLRDFETITVPRAIEDFTTSRVLTMEFIHGRKITELGPLAHLEMDGSRMAEDLFKAYLQQTLVDGIFHADPHPGNVLVTYDHRVALVDLGMIGRISPSMQERLLKLLLAISEGDSDRAADIAIKIGEILEEFNEMEFRRKVAEIVASQQNATVEELQIGRVMLEFTRVAGENGVRVPSELTMLSKTLLNLDEVGRTLDPRFDPNESIRRNAADITRQRLMKSVSPGNMITSAMDAKEFVEELPNRVNRILDMLARNQLKFNVDAIDEDTLVDGFQKISNRITTGLILAALIIGAALLMRIETSFTLFGYPGLAIVLFLAAAAGGFWLVVSILMNDRAIRKKKG